MQRRVIPLFTEPEETRDPRADQHTFAGLLPVHQLRRALERVSSNATESSRGRFLVLTHRSPDPDALGACEGLRLLFEAGFGYRATVATLGRIHRAENLALLRTLDLDLVDYDGIDPETFAGAALVDTQPEFAHTVIPAHIPIVAVFDHHVPPDKNGHGGQTVPHKDVRLDLGATSSMIYEYLRDAGVELDAKTASALFCGVRYDTADLSRNASPLDEEAYYETFRRGDRAGIAQIHHPPLPREYYRELHKALSLARQHGPLVLALLGKVANPESVAEMADFFLRMKGASWVVVGGAYENTYVLSLRTDYAFGKAYPLMKRVLEGMGAFGGHGHIAGGQVPLEDTGESTIKEVERTLRTNALSVIGKTDEEDGIPEEGRPLFE
jgi:nanoRNase/pAp phosphatase (c-di-AMP/oligoRNAs hydrolase)